MNIDRLCCSSQQAQKLKNLGVVQQSIIYKHPDWNNLKTASELYDKYGISFKDVSISYFTVSELSELLPFGNFCIPVFEGEIAPESEVMYSVHLETWIMPNRFRTVLVDAEFRKKYIDSGIDYTMAESLCSMLIKMLEEGVITVNYCNEVLVKL